jgi:hypothetical protein
VKFDYNSLLRGDPAGRFDIYKTGIQSTIYTPNEARAMEEMDPRENGDELLVPPGYLPLGAQMVAAAGGGKVPVKKPSPKPGAATPPVGGGESPSGSGNGHRSVLDGYFSDMRVEMRRGAGEYGETDESLASEECND